MKKLLSSLACIALVASASGQDAIDAAILDDILHSYIGHVPTECNTPEQTARTSFSFEWPGTNSLSSWKTAFAPYEQGMFQAIMSHNDTGNRSWSMRIGTGGNMYSHFFPHMHGETLPPQENANAPWVDEVQQSVAVPLYLNTNQNFFIHQAGAYQRDGNYTSAAPFYSPSLAKYCKDNYCIFASWGTQAHVPNTFTSPIMVSLLIDMSYIPYLPSVFLSAHTLVFVDLSALSSISISIPIVAMALLSIPK